MVGVGWYEIEVCRDPSVVHEMTDNSAVRGTHGERSSLTCFDFCGSTPGCAANIYGKYLKSIIQARSASE